MSAKSPRVVIQEPATWSPPKSGAVKGTIQMGSAPEAPVHGPVKAGNHTARVVTALVALTSGLALFDLYLLSTGL